MPSPSNDERAVDDTLGGRLATASRAGGTPARHRLFLAPALLLCGIALVGCKEQAPAPAPSAAPPAVFVVPVERQAVTQASEFIGRVEAIDRVDVRARVTGFLAERHFNEGDTVRAGETLFTIEQAPFAAEVALRQAQVERAEAELRNAAIQVQRGQELVRTNSLARATLDERIAAEAQAKAEVAAAEATLQQARIQYGYTQIKAVFDGRAGRSPLSPGNVVGPDSGVLVTIVRDDPIRVSFPVTQRDLLKVRREGGGAGGAGMQVLVRLPDGTMHETAGQLAFLDVTTNRSTDSVLVQAVVPNAQRLLTDGQAVTVVVQAAQPQQALVIPQSALQIDQQGPFVLVVGADNKVEVKRIRTAPGPGRSIQVTEGLEAGQLVITEGAQRARPGATVTPRPMEAPPAGAVPPNAARPG